MIDLTKAIQAARTWCETPYHHRARVKGVGCDCLMLIVEAYTAAGVLPPDLKIPPYPADIMFHKNDSSYLDAVLAYCDETPDPQPGGLAMWKFGKTFSHAAVIVSWPTVIHAYAAYGEVLEMSVIDDSRLVKRKVRFFYPRAC